MAHDLTAGLIENYQVQLIAGQHSWIADEPKKFDGDEIGPGPFELLLGALASCTLVTVKAYAGKAGIPMEWAAARLRGEFVEKDDGSEEYHIRETFEVRGELSEQDLKRLHNAAGRCPVAKLLAKGAVIETEIVKV